MKVSMTHCDNPKCKVMSRPEATEELEGFYASPYAWWLVDTNAMGCGPFIKNLECCSIKCISPAVQHAVEELDRKEREKWEK